jgi:hypothetical protein
MYNIDTGEPLCQIDMPITIDESGVFSASEYCTVNGTSAFISHTGSVYTNLIEIDAAGNLFVEGSISGVLGISNTFGLEIESEFYGQCLLQNNTTTIDITWSSLIFNLDGTTQTVIGNLYYSD